MVTPDKEYDQFLKDPRTLCKFGIDCYQKNPLHRQKYKHPPKKRLPTKDDEAECQSSKRQKINETATDRFAGGRVQETVSESEESSDDYISDKGDEVQSNGKIELDDSKKLPVVQLDKKAFIKEKFLFDMPEDFYSFWDFCVKLKSKDPKTALDNVDLVLVGPYDVMAGKFTNAEEIPPEDYLIHWRYYYDPPEFQTVIKGSDSTGYHLGYFRDDSDSLPVFVAGNHAKTNGEFACMGENIFAAVRLHLEKLKKSCDPFKKMSISKLITAIEAKAKELKLDLSEKTPNIKNRDKKILSRTFNKLGLVVPYNRKTKVGYRNLVVSDKELRALLDSLVKASDKKRDDVMSKLQPVLTYTSIAADECDFGTGIELGWDILAHGIETLNSTILRFLTISYELLDRPLFAKIITAHMRNRKNETKLSII